MQKLWQKNNYKQNDLIESFLTKEDIILDNYLVEFEIYGSIAQAVMLCDIGIITKNECRDLLKGLLKILTLYKEGKFVMEFGDEDIHTKVENYLTKNIGEAGKKIHTGRSRNDQILLDLRLFMKSELLEIWDLSLKLAQTFLDQAKKYEFIPMPGFTHMQKAMPSSVGMWFSSFAEALEDNMVLLEGVYTLVDQSPLGAGAGYGVSLNLDRKKTADLLGFAKVQNNSLYSQNSRGKIEGSLLFVCMQIVSEISKFSSDILLFTTSDFNYFKVDDMFTTGSSIMPQKKNVDVAEVLRGKIHIMLGQFLQVYTTVLNTPSGYNRDFQETKKPFIESLLQTKDVLIVANELVKSVEPNKDVLKSSMTKELFATDAAFALVNKGWSFRDAYVHIGNNIANLSDVDADAAIKKSTHAGSTGNLGLDGLSKKLLSRKSTVKKHRSSFTKAKAHLLTIKI